MRGFPVRAVADKKSVVPDYIYVNEKYSFDNPSKPYVIIETKAPALKCEENNEYCYKKLEISKSVINELSVEVKSCGRVIFTDGITWFFCVWKDKVEVIETIELIPAKIDLQKPNITSNENEKTTDNIEHKQWQSLKNIIKDFLRNAKIDKESNI